MPVVESAAIRAVTYDAAGHQLVVIFRETGAYAYDGVSLREYEDFLRASSKGGFFNERIKDRYPFRKL